MNSSLFRFWPALVAVVLAFSTAYGLERLQESVLALQINASPCGSPILARQASATIDLNDHSFTPPVIEVRPGQVVRWVNKSGQTKEVEANPDQHYGKACSTLMSGKIAPGQAYYFMFTRTGRWPFYDTSNHNSAGQVIVKLLF